MKSSELRGRRVAVLAADGFEKVELTIPVSALIASGAKVDIISLRRGSIRGVNLHEPASRVRVNKTLDKADPTDYDALLVPGGFINPDLLRQSANARAFVKEFDRQQKPIASLCHGPWLLASAGILQGRVLASWPGIRDDVVNAGATWLDEPLVKDGNLITSRGPQDLVPFVHAIKQHFAKDAPMVRHDRAPSSSPQATQPPQLVISAVKWLPKPSTRTAMLLVAVAVGLLSRARRGEARSTQKTKRAA